MIQTEANKDFILEYFTAISGNDKTRELNEQYIDDESLIEHILFFDAILPKYELYADEMIAEGDKVVVRARCKAIHKGAFNGIPPTNKSVEFPFVIRYTVKNLRIIDHWILSDQMEFLQQIGVVEPTTSEAH